MTPRNYIWFDPDGSRAILGLMGPKGLEYAPIRRSRERSLWIRDGAKIQRAGWLDADSVNSRSLSLLFKLFQALKTGAETQGAEVKFELVYRFHVEKPGERPRLQVGIAGG